MIRTVEMATDGPFNDGNIDSRDVDSSFSRSAARATMPPPCLSSTEAAVASACKLASDRDPDTTAAVALLSDGGDAPVVMATSWPTRDEAMALSATGPDDVAAAARLERDETLPTASDGRVVVRRSSEDDVAFSAAINQSVNQLINRRLRFFVFIFPECVLCITKRIIIIIIITSTLFIVLSSTAPAICESSLWFIWAKVGQRQVAANSQAKLQT